MAITLPVREAVDSRTPPIVDKCRVALLVSGRVRVTQNGDEYESPVTSTGLNIRAALKTIKGDDRLAAIIAEARIKGLVPITEPDKPATRAGEKESTGDFRFTI